MADDQLQLIASIDISQLTAGLAGATNAISSSTTDMAGSFKDMATSTVSSMSQTTTAVKAATTATQEGGEVTISVWQRVATMMKAAAMEIIESQGEVKEAFITTQEVAEATATGVTGIWGALGTLLGVGIFVNLVGEVADVNIELGHLSEKTGMAIESLAGLQLMAKENGTGWDSISTALVRVQRAQVLAAEGSQDSAKKLTTQEKAFHRLGISMDEVKNASPEELFARISGAIQHTEGTANKVTSAFQLFGRGGAALIPIFEQYGDQIMIVAKEQAGLTGITQETLEQSKIWKHDTEELSAVFKSMLIPAMQAIVGALKLVWDAFKIVGNIISDFATLVHAEFDIMKSDVVGFGKVMAAIMAGDAVGAWNAFKGMTDNAKYHQQDAMAQIKQGWKATIAGIKMDWEQLGTGPQTKEGAPNIGGDDNKGDKMLKEWKSNLQAMQDAQANFHTLSKADEAEFWASKLSAAREDADTYKEVYHLMREAERASANESLKDSVSSTQARVQDTKQGSLERVTILNEEVAYMKSIGAEESAEFKHTQAEAVAAQKAYDEQQKKLTLDREQVKIAAVRQGTAEQLRLIDGALAVAERLYGKDSTEYVALQKQKEHATQQFNQKSQQLQAEDLAADAAHQLALLNQTKSRLDKEFQLHHINSTQHTQQLLKIENEEYQIQLTALQKKQKLYKQDEDNWVKIQNEMRVLSDRHAQQIIDIKQREVTRRQQLEDGLKNSIQSSFSSGIMGMIQGTETLTQFWNNMVTGMIGVFVNMLGEMLAQWIATHILMKIFGSTTEKATAVGKITAEAAVGAAAAWASTAAIPVVGPAMAPGVAAATYGSIMGFAPMALLGFEHGGIIPETGLIFGHKNETVIPEPLSSRLHNMADGGGGGDVHLHSTYQISAIDGASVQNVVETHGDIFGRAAVNHIKRAFQNREFKIR